MEYIDFHETNDYLFIIMEYVACGTLADCIKPIKLEDRLDEGLTRLVALQMCEALNYLHGRSIAHRDVKPENILIVQKQPLSLKLSDFGLSKIAKDEETFLKTFCGTPLYCAPETFPGYIQVKEGLPQKRHRMGDP